MYRKLLKAIRNYLKTDAIHYTDQDILPISIQNQWFENLRSMLSRGETESEFQTSMAEMRLSRHIRNRPPSQSLPEPFSICTQEEINYIADVLENYESLSSSEHFRPCDIRLLSRLMIFFGISMRDIIDYVDKIAAKAADVISQKTPEILHVSSLGVVDHTEQLAAGEDVYYFEETDWDELSDLLADAKMTRLLK